MTCTERRKTVERCHKRQDSGGSRNFLRGGAVLNVMGAETKLDPKTKKSDDLFFQSLLHLATEFHKAAVLTH